MERGCRGWMPQLFNRCGWECLWEKRHWVGGACPPARHPLSVPTHPPARHAAPAQPVAIEVEIHVGTCTQLSRTTRSSVV